LGDAARVGRAQLGDGGGGEAVVAGGQAGRDLLQRSREEGGGSGAAARPRPRPSPLAAPPPRLPTLVPTPNKLAGGVRPATTSGNPAEMKSAARSNESVPSPEFASCVATTLPPASSTGPPRAFLEMGMLVCSWLVRTRAVPAVMVDVASSAAATRSRRSPGRTVSTDASGRAVTLAGASARSTPRKRE